MSTYVHRFDSNQPGLKVGVKDCIDVKGTVSQLGSRAYAHRQPAKKDAQVVARLKAAGCQLTGKLNMHELAFGMTGVNEWTGTPINPRYPDFIPGGSSSGSAVAAAEGDVDFTLGTDTGGSVRLPAACCGVYGLKPTYGLVSREGVTPSQSSLDCVGVLASEPQMLTRAMTLLVDDFSHCPLKAEIRLGVLDVEASPMMIQGLSQYVTALGLPAETMTLPLLAEAFEAGLTLISAEAWQGFGHLLADQQLGQDVAARLHMAQDISHQQIIKAESVRQAFTAQVDEALTQCDLLILPAMPDFPLTREQALSGQQDLNASALVRPFNLSGHPAMCIPIPCEEGPVSVQVIAPKGNDQWLCEFAERMAPHLTELSLKSYRGDHQ